MSDWISQDGGRGREFVVFGDDGIWSDEPVTDADFEHWSGGAGNDMSSMAWSANVDYYFVCLPVGVLIVPVGSDSGMLCRKKSWRLIEAFFDAPRTKRKKVA